MPRQLRILLVAASVLVPTAVWAQAIPDTTAPWAYYPLGIGDEWHYEVEESYYQYCTPCRYQLTRKVESLDTLDGRRYASVRWRSYGVPSMPNAPPSTWTEHLRYDTLGATPLKWATFGEYYPWDVNGCRLDEAFPVSPDSSRAITCPDGWEGIIQGGYRQPLPFGGEGAIKLIARHQGTLYFTTSFAAGIGALAQYRSFEIDLDYRDSLVYARVAGVEYGTPIVAMEPPPADGGLALQVTPNPAAGGAAASFHLGVAGLARLTLHDQLGRRVLVAHDGWLPAGVHRVALGAAGLPAGAYVVRAATPHGTAAATLALLR